MFINFSENSVKQLKLELENLILEHLPIQNHTKLIPLFQIFLIFFENRYFFGSEMYIILHYIMYTILIL